MKSNKILCNYLSIGTLRFGTELPEESDKNKLWQNKIFQIDLNVL